MLNIKIDSRGYIEVEEIVMSAITNKRTYFYYDMKNKKRSIFGKKGDYPSQAMTQTEIDWVEKYYVPKLEQS